MKVIYIFSVLALLFATSCKKDKVAAAIVDPNCTDTISFVQKIQPMILQNCATSGCHDAGSQASGYDFSNYAGIAPNVSIMLSAMRSETGVVPMPQGGPQLEDSLIQQFSCWASQGALEN